MANSLERFTQRLYNLEREVRSRRGLPLANTSIVDGYIEEYDENGDVAQIIGRQHDNTHIAAPVVGPPPPQPTAPAVEATIEGLVVSWDGFFADSPTTVAPMDFARVDIAVGPAGFDPIATPPATAIMSPRGGNVLVSGLVAGVTYDVVLIARALTGKASPPSSVAQGVPDDKPAGMTPEEKAVLESASGKSAVVHSVDAPGPEDLTGYAAGDTWFQRSASTGGTVGLWRFDGAAWQATTLLDSVIGNLDAGKITFGEMEGDRIKLNTLNADRLIARTLDVSRLTVGAMHFVNAKMYDVCNDHTLYVQNGGTGQLTTVTGATDAVSGNSYIRATGNVEEVQRKGTEGLIVYDPNTLYRVTYRARMTAGTANDLFYGAVVGVMADEQSASGGAAYVSANGAALPVGGGWQTFVGYVKGIGTPTGLSPSAEAPSPMPEGTRFIAPMFYANNGADSTTAVTEIDLIAVEALMGAGSVGSVEIADGAVTAANLKADAITGLLVTGAKIETLAAANRGIKIDGATNTLKAYDAVGNERFSLNGNTGDLDITGTFKTDTTYPRVRMINQSQGGGEAYIQFETTQQIGTDAATIRGSGTSLHINGPRNASASYPYAFVQFMRPGNGLFPHLNVTGDIELNGNLVLNKASSVLLTNKIGGYSNYGSASKINFEVGNSGAYNWIMDSNPDWDGWPRLRSSYSASPMLKIVSVAAQIRNAADTAYGDFVANKITSVGGMDVSGNIYLTGSAGINFGHGGNVLQRCNFGTTVVALDANGWGWLDHGLGVTPAAVSLTPASHFSAVTTWIIDMSATTSTRLRIRALNGAGTAYTNQGRTVTWVAMQ